MAEKHVCPGHRRELSEVLQFIRDFNWLMTLPAYPAGWRFRFPNMAAKQHAINMIEPLKHWTSNPVPDSELELMITADK